MLKPSTGYAFLPALLSLSLLMSNAAVMAEETQEGFEAKHKVVIQISSDDPRTHQIALNNALNLQKDLGIDNVAVEVVAYGPGLKLFTGRSPESMRVPSLAQQNIRFSVCGNTISQLTAKMGHPPTLIEGVKVVPGGVVRIVELQEQGYAYIRP